MATPLTRPHTAALVAALVAAGLEAAAGEVPSDAGWQGTPGQDDFVPYAMVFGASEILSGPAAAPDDDGELVRQVTYVGESHEQAEWARDVGRAAVLAGIDVDDRNTRRVTLDLGVAVTRDDDVQPSVWVAIDRYRIYSFA